MAPEAPCSLKDQGSQCHPLVLAGLEGPEAIKNKKINKLCKISEEKALPYSTLVYDVLSKNKH